VCILYSYNEMKEQQHDGLVVVFEIELEEKITSKKIQNQDFVR
jgi:hypothetical protein